MLNVTFSSPYTESPLSYSPYYIPVYLVFSSPVSAPDVSAIHVSHGLLTNLHYIGDRWLCYLSPAHQGTVRIWADANVFTDDAGRSSLASNVLTLRVSYATVQCALLAPLLANGNTLIELRLHCERSLQTGISDLAVINATVHSLVDQADSTLSILVNPLSSVNTISVDMTVLWKTLNGASCSGVTVTMDRSTSTSAPDTSSVASNDSPYCTFEVTPFVYSEHTSLAASVICSQPISSVTSAWLFCSECTIMYDITTSPNHRRVLVVAPYSPTTKLQIMNGALQTRNGEFVKAIAPVVVNTGCQRPSVALALENGGRNNSGSTVAYSFSFVAIFSTDMVRSSIESLDNLELVKDSSIMVTLEAIFVSNSVVKYKCDLSAFGDVQITYKGGVSYTQNGVLNQASPSLLVQVKEYFFSLSSSMDTVKEVFADQVAVRVLAPASLVSIHSSDFVTQHCEIIKFVMGTSGGSTVIDMVVLVQQEGDFSVQLPQHAVTLTTGVANKEWMLQLKYTHGG